MATRGEGSRYKLPGPGSQEGGRGPDYVAHVFDFLGVIRYNLTVLCLVDGTCGQRPSCVRCSLLCFLRFSLAAPRKDVCNGARTHSWPPCLEKGEDLFFYYVRTAVFFWQRWHNMQEDENSRCPWVPAGANLTTVSFWNARYGSDVVNKTVKIGLQSALYWSYVYKETNKDSLTL